MRRIHLAYLLAALGVCATSHAAVQSVRALPARAAATTGQDLTLPVSWQVTLDAADTTGAISGAGLFVDATTGAPLGLDVRTTLGTPTGGGVRQHAETVTIDAATLATWHAQGIRRIGYRRTFVSPATGSQRAGQVLISLTGSSLAELREPAAGELRVWRLELVFASGKRIEIAERNRSLAARLTVAYAGSGTLRGRWQVAEPGGGGAAIFRTLALVNESLPPSQRATLDSPPLPTHIAGRYALRFCLDGRPGEECADSSAGVQTIYEVTERATAGITGLRPATGDAGPVTTFAWEAVPGAALYQLQVLRPVAGDGFEFVSGVLVSGQTSAVALSQLVLAKLEPGLRYRWRVTAHDADGRLLARSDSAEFVYRP